MLSDGYTVTGAAYLQRNEYDKQWTTGEFAQEFMSDTKYFEQGYGVQSEIDENKVYNTCAGQMSVEEFKELFDAYYANLKQELQDKKVAYEAAKEGLKRQFVMQDMRKIISKVLSIILPYTNKMLSNKQRV